MQYHQLTSYEQSLVNDQQLILTKNIILGKVVALLANVSEVYSSYINVKTPSEIFKIPSKIARGENYNGLPYVILDYPRNFAKTDMLAIRSFFWWGNYFSIFLMIAGEYKMKIEEKLIVALQSGQLDDWYIQLDDDKWNHYIESTNYQLVANCNFTNFSDFTFIKLAKKIPLHQWDQAKSFYEENFKFLAEMISR
jgi:hypothetical protein